MILTLFIVLMLIALSLIIISILTKEGVFSIIGFIFIFFLSVFVFMPGNLTIPSGSNVNLTISGSSVTGTITDSYTDFNDTTSQWFGRWLAIISAIGLVLSLIEYTRLLRRDDTNG